MIRVPGIFLFRLQNDFQNVGNETLFITDYKNVKISLFDWLAAKLWLKEMQYFVGCSHF